MRLADFSDVTFSDEEEALDYLETHFHDLRTAYSEASNMNQIYVMDAEIDTDDALEPLQAKPKTVKKTTPNYEQLRPYFLQVSSEKVRKTFENTTQFATAISSGRNLQQTIKSPNPAHNVFRRNDNFGQLGTGSQWESVDRGCHRGPWYASYESSNGLSNGSFLFGV